mmetsp:Transcript_58051/g.149441  ORF Transcript_58051/g.149441 Transcript_58051/m.149441 type:complete len:368 (-) Transcript_58051:136-1239(-)
MAIWVSLAAAWLAVRGWATEVCLEPDDTSALQLAGMASHPQFQDNQDDDGELSSFLMRPGKLSFPRDKSLNIAPWNASWSERRGVAVCIVGQEVRLEHISKVENVLRPLHDHIGHGDVSTFVVLQKGEARFSNKPLTFSSKAATVPQNDMEFRRKMKSLLGPSYTDGVSTTLEALTDEHVSFILKSWPNLRKDVQNRKDRFRNYLSQFKNMHTCMGLVKSAEARRGALFEFVLKLRDNTIVLKPFHWMSVHNVTQFKACDGWGGINDKVAVLLREHAVTYMMQPYNFMLDVMSGVEEEIAKARTIQNTETLLSSVLLSHGMKYSLVDADQLPWVDGRRKEDGRWCLVPSRKDCRPSLPWTLKDIETC